MLSVAAKHAAATTQPSSKGSISKAASKRTSVRGKTKIKESELEGIFEESNNGRGTKEGNEWSVSSEEAIPTAARQNKTKESHRLYAIA